MLLIFQQKYEKNSNIKFFIVSFFIIREKSFNNMFFYRKDTEDSELDHRYNKKSDCSCKCETAT